MCSLNKILIIAGVPGAGKSSVLKEVHKKRSKTFKIISFGTKMFNLCIERNLVENRDQIRNLNHELQKQLQIETAELIAKEHGNYLLDTHCTIKTPAGYMSGLTDKMLFILKPVAIILVDAHEVEISGRRKLDKNRPERTIESFEDVKEHKVINRAFATSFAQKSDSLLKIVQNNTGEFESAVEEIVQTLDFVTSKS
ncbi:MAG: Adenylate kinase [Candidatus Heimdallarchaeota archaeon LC_3]|nr:MAG: Adenylate kinase [Candidatus Heimdallarchaeota archaeon LC_3]